MKNITKQAFTLVELIVVITILTVLGTIAVLSLQNYTLSARDSVRVNDLNTIKSAIEYARIEQGKYITPDNGVNITYSGSIVVWNQGTFGKQARRKTKKRLDKVPVDPLTQDEYTFSVTANKGEFELGAIMEGDDLVQTPPSVLNQTYAATNYRAFVTGTYNGKIAKAYSGSTLYIFALPSIISADLGTPTIEYQTLQNKLVMKGYKNLPSSYDNNDNGVIPAEVDFVNTNNVVVFSGSTDTLKNDGPSQITLISNLQQAYSGTAIENNSEIQPLLQVDTTTNPEGTQFLAQNLIQSNLDRKYTITAKNVIPYNPIANSCLEMTTKMVDNLNTYFTGALNLTRSEWCSKTSILLYNGDVISHFSGPLPAEIGNLTDLTSVTINGNWSKPGNITGFPESIKYLVNLHSITIGANKINNIETLANISSLQYVDINNVYTYIHTHINNLGLFKDLAYLNGLKVNVIVGNLSELFNGTAPLQNLGFSNINDNIIPDNIDNKSELRSLSFRGDFTNLPSEMGNLPNLSGLYISHSQITELPESFSNLLELQTLYLQHNNNLITLFSGLGNLSKLKSLNLIGSDLKFLPESMVNLNQVELFEVAFNGYNNKLYNLNRTYNNGDNFCEENIMKSGANTCISKNGGTFSFSLIENGGYTLNADKTVLSANGSGLSWQTHKLNNTNAVSLDTVYLRYDAVTYCDDLVLGGMNNWRMPTFIELGHIIDTRFSSPMVDQTYLSAKNQKYWSTTIGSGAQKRKTLDFTDGTKSFYGESIFPSDSHIKRPVRCVHD